MDFEFAQDGENSPPAAKNIGPAPGGVGSPSKNAPRHTSNSPKTKASSLPGKKKISSPVLVKKSATPSPPKKAPVSTTVEGDVSNGDAVSSGSSMEEALVGSSAPAVSDNGAKETGKKVVIALTRRVSVLRPSNAGAGR